MFFALALIAAAGIVVGQVADVPNHRQSLSERKECFFKDEYVSHCFFPEGDKDERKREKN